MKDSILQINNLMVSFPYGNKKVQVVRGIDIDIKEGDVLGILGESGSGKTVTASSIINLIKYDGGQIDSGSIYFNGIDLLKCSNVKLREISGKDISYIFQNPGDSLNPYRKIGKQIGEIQQIHGKKPSKEAVLHILRDVGLYNAEIIYDMYPSQLSGGQCQRVNIAMSLICTPKLIIADEPTSSIDASLEGIVLDLLKSINQKYGISIIIITHNLKVVKKVCNRVAVMYGGLIMEEGSASNILNAPKHPYTVELIKCAESLSNNDSRLYSLEGKSLSPNELKNECPFYSRCPVGTKECTKGIPTMKSLRPLRKVRCLYVRGDVYE